jgi:hypothetical protein
VLAVALTVRVFGLRIVPLIKNVEFAVLCKVPRRSEAAAISTRAPGVVVMSCGLPPDIVTVAKRNSSAPIKVTVPAHENCGKATAPAVVSMVTILVAEVSAVSSDTQAQMR